MAKKKKRRPGSTIRTIPASSTNSNKSLFGAVKDLWLWLGASGILVAVLSVAFDYFNGDLQLSYSQPLGTAYELVMTNVGPTDRVIDKFRVKPPLGQQVMYKITEDIYAKIGSDGIALPGGRDTYVPAAEFKELDGQIIPAKTPVKFRLPPLSDRSWLQPEAALIEIEYSSTPKNPTLRVMERFLQALTIKQTTTTTSFLVLNNYWTPVKSGSLKDAIRQVCRENSSVAQFEACRSR